MRLLLSLFILLALTGCAHHKLAVWVTQQQLTEFTGRALTAMRVHEGVRLASGATTPIVGDYDSTQPIRYTTQTRPSPTVIVHVPTRSIPSYAYTEFAFDAQSGIITGVSYGTIHQ
ncbi:MAG: hypothetical protein JWR69_4586 [Pedosphaera sp.]|nr:hypothetical protein [Pedosphaera sp.]